MFLSVITPTKNSEKFISDTIESVISQKFKKYEHIILDNLSSDKTLQEIKKFRNKKIKIISEKDNGIYYAMNKGANLSKGNFLTFLNSDDFILDKDFFKNAYSILNKHKYDILYSNIIYKENLFKLNRKYITGHYNTNLNKLGWHIPHPGTIVRKDFFFKSGMFSTNYKISSDFDFFIKSQNNLKTNFYYYNKFTIKMSPGGASSGFLNIVKANAECYRSLKSNKIKNPIQFIIAKILRKIFQLF
jgi:glycosyltransferase involved in cell wall biosynthesis